MFIIISDCTRLQALAAGWQKGLAHNEPVSKILIIFID
jgi:hypothetical protein